MSDTQTAPLLTVVEMAELLGKDRSTINRLRREGWLAYVQVGPRDYRYPHPVARVVEATRGPNLPAEPAPNVRVVEVVPELEDIPDTPWHTPDSNRRPSDDQDDR